MTESFFNLSVQIRFNKVYKAISRRVPLVVVKISPTQFTPPSVRNKLVSLVQKLATAYEKSNRVRTTSRSYIDHKPPTLAIYSAKLDTVADTDDTDADDDYDDVDETAAAPASGVFAESVFVGIRPVCRVGYVIAVLPTSK